MAITVAGVEGLLTDTELAYILADLGDIGASHGVALGLSASLSTADRTIKLNTGRALMAGASFTSSALANVQFAANTSTTKSRIDLVCAQVDWNAARTAFASAGGEANLTAATTAAKAAAGSFVVVPGTVATAPTAFYGALVQTPGNLWQEPLFEQPIRPGVGQFSTSLGDTPVDVRSGNIGWIPWDCKAGVDIPFQNTTIDTTSTRYRVMGKTVELQIRRAAGSAWDRTAGWQWPNTVVNGSNSLPQRLRPSKAVQGAARLSDLPVSATLTPTGDIVLTGGPPVVFSNGSYFQALFHYFLD